MERGSGGKASARATEIETASPVGTLPTMSTIHKLGNPSDALRLSSKSDFAAIYRLYSELQSPGPLSYPKVYKFPGLGIDDFEDLLYNLPPQHIQRHMAERPRLSEN